jgi:hypothetical protein
MPQSHALDLDLSCPVTDTPHDLFMLLCAVRPLAGELSDPAEYGYAAQEVWRAFLDRLADAGKRSLLCPMTPEKRLRKAWVRAYNCPPCGYKVGRRTWPCHSSLCPWCHGRRSLDVFRLLLDACRLLAAEVRPSPRLRVVGVTHTRLLGEDARETSGTVGDDLLRGRSWRYELARIAKPLGMYTALSSVPDKRANVWRSTCRALILTDREDYYFEAEGFEPDSRTAGFFKVSRLPIRHGFDPFHLARLAARVLRYPVELLRADPDRLALLVRGRRRKKLTASYGLLRPHVQNHRKELGCETAD